MLIGPGGSFGIRIRSAGMLIGSGGSCNMLIGPGGSFGTRIWSVVVLIGSGGSYYMLCRHFAL